MVSYVVGYGGGIGGVLRGCCVLLVCLKFGFLAVMVVSWVCGFSGFRVCWFSGFSAF